MKQTKSEVQALRSPSGSFYSVEPDRVEVPLHVLERLPTKSLKVMALLIAGMSLNEIAIRLDVRKSTARSTLKKLYDMGESANLARYLLILFAEISPKTYKSDMDEVGEIAKILSDWDSNAVTKLAEDLRSGKLAQHYAAAAEPGLTEPTADRTSPPGGQLYAARPDRKESAPQFIERVYGGAGWLTGEFTRADLRKTDSSALIGLENWERKHGRATLNLPTVKERNDKLLERDPATLTKAERQEQGRIRLSRHHHGIQ